MVPSDDDQGVRGRLGLELQPNSDAGCTARSNTQDHLLRGSQDMRASEAVGRNSDGR